MGPGSPNIQISLFSMSNRFSVVRCREASPGCGGSWKTNQVLIRNVLTILKKHLRKWLSPNFYFVKLKETQTQNKMSEKVFIRVKLGCGWQLSVQSEEIINESPSRLPTVPSRRQLIRMGTPNYSKSYFIKFYNHAPMELLLCLQKSILNPDQRYSCQSFKFYFLNFLLK